jgi:DNA polymerase-3 subunit beta
MKIQLEKTALVQLLQRIYSITEKKTTVAILSNALLKTTNESLDFFVTDLELSMRAHIASQTEVPGSSTVSARKLLEIVRELPQSTVTLETLPNNKMAIYAGRSRFELATIPAEDFPHLSFHEETVLAPCESAVMRTAFNKTLHAVPAEEDPFNIPGLFIHPVEETNEVRLVSSDGHRLSYYQLSKESFPDLDIGEGIIVPRKGVQEVIKVLEKEDEVFFGLHENSLLLKTSDTMLSVRLLEAEFPEYNVIIPEVRPFSFTIEREILHLALKRVATLADQKWRHVRFVVTGETLELECGNPELGNANDILDIVHIGDDFTVAFNVRYVLDAIQAMESAQIRFEWVDEFHGGVFVEPDDPGYLTLIMPMVLTHQG